MLMPMTIAYRMFRTAAAFAMLSLLLGCAVVGSRPAIGEVNVLFFVKAPNAASVVIAGSFNQWDRERNRLSGPDPEGRWRVTIPLVPGRYEYLFLIDGTTWVLDGAAPSVDDGMGGRNSVVIVGPK